MWFVVVGLAYLESHSFRLQIERPALIRLDLHLETSINLKIRAHSVVTRGYQVHSHVSTKHVSKHSTAQDTPAPYCKTCR